MQEEQIILGVDPGTTIMGFGIIAINKNSMRMIQMHELYLKKYDNHLVVYNNVFMNKNLNIDYVVLGAGIYGLYTSGPLSFSQSCVRQTFQ